MLAADAHFQIGTRFAAGVYSELDELANAFLVELTSLAGRDRLPAPTRSLITFDD